MAYTTYLRCTNCGAGEDSASIADATTIATYLTTPSSNADCSVCGCNTLAAA